MPAVLNDIERKILDYMVRYLRSNTYQPSIREIGEEFGIRSTKTVSEHLRALAQKGYLERDPSRSRGIRILGVDLSPDTVSIPCFSDLPDTVSGFASDGVEAYLAMDRRMGGGRGAYFVRVRTAALSGLGVDAGDLLLVEPAGVKELRHGDLAVVRLNAQPELFRVRTAGGRMSLRSGAPDAEPVVVEAPDRLDVAGRVTALYRRLDDAPVATTPPTAH